MTSSARSSRDALLARLRSLLPELDATLRRAPDADRWIDRLARLDRHASRLVDGCARASLPRLEHVSFDVLAAWIDAGEALAAGGGWRAERRARAFFEEPRTLDVLDPDLFRPWAELAMRFGKALDDGRFFALLDERLARWSRDERRAWLAIVAAVVERDPRAATALYRDLGTALERPDPVLRAGVLDALARSATAIEPSAITSLLPVLGALLVSIPVGRIDTAVSMLRAVASATPMALVGLLRALPRVFEITPDETRLMEWIARGIAIGDANPEAAVAFFGLASRTSERTLLASPTAVPLAEVQGELRKFVQMLSGTPAVPHGVGPFRFRPPLESYPDSGQVTLPDVVDRIGTYEDDARLFRVLAAFVAGRREAGTYADPELLNRLEADGEPSHLAEVVRMTDGYRVAQHLARTYPGLARDIAWSAEQLLVRLRGGRAPAIGPLLDAVLALALVPNATTRAVPTWLAAVAGPVLAAIPALGTADATVADATAVARTLAPIFAFAREPDAANAVLADLLPLLLEDDGEPFTPDDGASVGAGGTDGAPGDDPAPEATPDDLLAELESLLDPEGTGVQTISPEELARLIEAGLLTKLRQARAQGLDESGLYVTQLLGKLLGDDATIDDAPAGGVGSGRTALPRDVDSRAAIFTYDEWDHRIEDYRPRWCRLREVPVAEDAGVFWDATLARHATLVPEIRRHFQRVRPELYRTLRGLEDGDDFDLGALVDARAELRARQTPTAKLYTRRARQERDVATLFLVDLSASTDEQASPDGDDRIIDVTRAALVLMAAALDEIGDAFAIYGFSGQGRDNVEFFDVKGFDERLTTGVRGRIGGIAPRGSTRMGTAIRHAVTKLRPLPQPSRHLILLSDGFPQDLDYGDDRHSHTYGIRDTATALREAEAAGVRPFCITVDAGGHDYLREMCSRDAYLVIDAVGDLPHELPKIYQRLVRAI